MGQRLLLGMEMLVEVPHSYYEDALAHLAAVVWMVLRRGIETEYASFAFVSYPDLARHFFFCLCQFVAASQLLPRVLLFS